MAKCLYCYKELNGNERDFHKACSKKIFGTLEAPILPYTHNNLNDLARQVIRSQTTLTGVQAKLSLDINNNTSLNFMLHQQRIQIFHSLSHDLIACSGYSRTRQ